MQVTGIHPGHDAYRCPDREPRATDPVRTSTFYETQNLEWRRALAEAGAYADRVEFSPQARAAGGDADHETRVASHDSYDGASVGQRRYGAPAIGDVSPIADAGTYTGVKPGGPASKDVVTRNFGQGRMIDVVI